MPRARYIWDCKKGVYDFSRIWDIKGINFPASVPSCSEIPIFYVNSKLLDLVLGVSL